MIQHNDQARNLPRETALVRRAKDRRDALLREMRHIPLLYHEFSRACSQATLDGRTFRLGVETAVA